MAADKQGAVCIILAAGFSQVEKDIDQATDAAARGLAGVPKALLPVAGKPMLDHWWEYLSQNRSAVSDVFIVSNAVNYKHFERWATAKGIDVSRVCNTGATSPERSRGVLRDIELGCRRATQALGSIESRNIIVFAGDTLFFRDFDLGRLLDFHNTKGGSLALYYKARETTEPAERGMCQVDPQTSKIVSFAEKPAHGERGYAYSFVSPLFYILEPTAWKKIAEFNESVLAQNAPASASVFTAGRFIEHAVETLKLPFWGMRMPGQFFLIGSKSGYADYLHLDTFFKEDSVTVNSSHRVRTKTYARVGVMGNPSDGFNGKTIAMTVQNFWASVEMWESEKLQILPHPLYDPFSFSGLNDLHFIGTREGYYGGTRLLFATCKRFQELCTNSGIALPRKNFTLKYDTNIPRQVGLSGSSAIVNCVFQALMKFYNLGEEHIPKEQQPSFVLSVESELGIQAGLQDRVVQVYQGLVYMDFDAEYMNAHGHGKYERLPREAFEWVRSLPFFIAYEFLPSDSGKIHSSVRARWEQNDTEVLEAMRKFADLTVRARDAILNKDHALLAELMDENFNTRRKLYGDECLGRNNLRMVDICQKSGAAVKFPGSGGAVLGLCRPAKATDADAGSATLQSLREALEKENYVFCPLDPVMPEEEEASSNGNGRSVIRRSSFPKAGYPGGLETNVSETGSVRKLSEPLQES